MDPDPRAGVLLDRRVVTDVIPMAVRAHDQLQRPVPFRERSLDERQRRDRRVDRDRLARRRVTQHVDVGPDRPDDGMHELHRPKRATAPPLMTHARDASTRRRPLGVARARALDPQQRVAVMHADGSDIRLLGEPLALKA